MSNLESKACRDSFVSMTGLVLPNDTNNHHTLFGGILLKKTDEIASIAARRHCRTGVVTASMDSVDFLTPIYPSDSITLEAYVSWTGRTSMEVFVKSVAEDLDSGKKRIAATAFLTFVALDKNKKPLPVPTVTPESDEERRLYETGEIRSNERKQRRKESKRLAEHLSL